MHAICVVQIDSKTESFNLFVQSVLFEENFVAALEELPVIPSARRL